MLTLLLSVPFTARATTAGFSFAQTQQFEEYKFLSDQFESGPSIKPLSSQGSYHLSAVAENVQPTRWQNVLLLRVSFINQAFTYSASDFHNLMFATAAEQSSVANYYLANSYGDFLLQPAAETQGVVNDGVVDVELAYEHPNFGDRFGVASNQLVRDAITAASAAADFASFDANENGQLEGSELAIVLIVAGYENAYGEEEAPTPNVWAHQKALALSIDGVSLSSYAMFGEKHQQHLASIGIISHELGHVMFDLPDLYDRRRLSNGIGNWGLMGLGSWNSHPDINGGQAGSSPAHMMAWSKIKAGFLSANDLIGSARNVNLASATTTAEAARLWVDPFRHGEHFLLELRTAAGFDRGLAGHGLLISHVDGWVGYGKRGGQNDLAEHKLVDIEEADGKQDLDGLISRGDELDVFNDAYGQDFFADSSVPSSADYQGNPSGIEVANIVFDQAAHTASAVITPAYAVLADNLGFDDGGIGSAWGDESSNPVSLVEFDLSASSAVLDANWVHGVDVYSHGKGSVTIGLFAAFSAGVVSSPLLQGVEQAVGTGWNRISFASAVSVAGLSVVYLQVETVASAGKIFSVDSDGEASGRSYIKRLKAGSASLDKDSFDKVNFDFNQRLLVAAQAQAFDYHVPQNAEIKQDDSQQAGSESVRIDEPITRTSAGSFGCFIFVIWALAFGCRLRFRVF